MRRHPDQYKESGIFESVQFLNESDDKTLEDIAKENETEKYESPNVNIADALE